MPNAVRPKFQVRRATVEDVGVLLHLHYRLFDLDTNHLLLLGRRFTTRALQWYCLGPGAFTLLAEDPACAVGYIAINEGSYYSVYRRNWIPVLRAFLSKPALLANRLVRLRLAALLRRRRRGPGANLKTRACLAYLAVEHAIRGKGVASALVLAALRECRARGWQEVVTSYRSNNIPIRYLLASLGFKHYPELDGGGLVSVRFDTAELREPKVPARTGPA